MTPRLGAALVLVLAAGCETGELSDAVKNFKEFAEVGDAPEREDAVKAAPPPKIVIGARRELETPRPHLVLDLEMPMQVDANLVRRSLEEAARGPEGRGHKLIIVRAWPGKLRHVVGPFGEMMLSTDGRDLAGAVVGNQRITLAEGRLGAAVLMEDVRALTALDAAYAKGLTKNEAVGAAVAGAKLSAERVEAALELAQKRFPAAAGE